MTTLVLDATQPLEPDEVAPDAVEAAPTRPASGLRAVDVSAWFGGRQVLERINLEMPARTVTALIGPSGCGKSTFLRILNRMHENWSLRRQPRRRGAAAQRPGRRHLRRPASAPTETRRRIGMVFQKPNPFPAMSISDNVLSGLGLSGLPSGSKAERSALVEECLTRAGLWNEVKARLGDAGGSLSGGQQQRLCIARSLAVRPEVLLMDEPCSALDPTSTRRIEETILELASDVTVVIVTHNMQQAQRVSTQAAFFLAAEDEPGRIVESGTTEAIFGAPTDPRTADYVGGRFG